MLLLLLCIVAVQSVSIPENYPDSEDAFLSVPELIRKYGYQCEEHKIVTPDEYILTLHRIPARIGVKPRNQVVFLMHGILSSSADWILLGPGSALAYTLADTGYDVWMGNARGNNESRNHTRLSPDSAEFWDFSWHEIGYIDLPTMIDFVLETTKQPDLIYIGHSQGTTSFYVMASMKPDYNKKIKAHFSLSPVAFMNHMTSPLLRIISLWQGTLGALLNIIGLHEFLPNNDFMAKVANRFCGDNSLTKLLCSDSLFTICGFSPFEMDPKLIPTIVGHTPAGSSTKQVLHFAQEIRSGHFRQYDYGISNNLQKYGSMKPPDYNLKKITAPVYLFYSHNDWIAAETDVLRLYNRLPNCQGRFLVTKGGFNHLDFMYGRHARHYVYNRVISLMQKYRN